MGIFIGIIALVFLMAWGSSKILGCGTTIGGVITGFLGGVGFLFVACGDATGTNAGFCAVYIVATVPIGVVISWVIAFVWIYLTADSKVTAYELEYEKKKKYSQLKPIEPIEPFSNDNRANK